MTDVVVFIVALYIFPYRIIIQTARQDSEAIHLKRGRTFDVLPKNRSSLKGEILLVLDRARNKEETR